MRRFLYILIAVLLLPALLYKLGVVVFIDDEGIRSLVAQEMIWRGNFVVPTLHGDAYLNKPPLWNWILALSFTLWGEASEWSARFPTVVALLGFAATTYAFSRHYVGKTLAAVHALTVITCGRMLFWDSMLALIDVCFSWVIYAQMMALYHYARRNEWWKAFGWSYLLTAVAFMLKGLPAIAFAGLSIVGLLWYRKSWPKFFSPAHIGSGLACLGIMGIYYAIYAQYIDLGLVAERLFTESGKRTAVHYELTETLSHLLAFPFEMFYHFLPWTLLLILFPVRNFWAQLRQNGAGGYMLVAFLINLPLYWLSPNVYPRYLLMLFPLLFGVGLVLYREHYEKGTRQLLIFHGILAGLMTLVALAFFFIPFVPGSEVVGSRWVISLGAGGVGLGLVYGFLRLTFPRLAGKLDGMGLKTSREESRSTAAILGGSPRSTYVGTELLVFVAFLLLLRLTFNIFVLPPRAAGDVKGQEVRRSAEALGKTYVDSDKELAIFGYTLMEPATSFYLERAYGGIVPRHFGAPECGTDYVVNKWQYPEVAHINAPNDSLFMRHQPDDPYYPVLDLCNFRDSVSTAYEEPLLDGMGTGLPQ